MADFIPDSFQNRYDWLLNLNNSIDGQASALGWDSGKVSAFKTFVQPLVTKYKAVLDQQSALELAVGAATTDFNTKEAELRRQLGEIRKNAGYTPGMGAALHITGIGGAIDPDTIKPELKAKAEMGHVRITGRKNYAQTVNIYWRRKGETTWKLLVAKRKTFPFDDQTPLATPGTPETREYMARGVIGDNEVGIPSDIVPVLFGG